ncbi:MAG: hypothetical protein R2811_13230 [Flavobacteriales bacterium]
MRASSLNGLVEVIEKRETVELTTILTCAAPASEWSVKQLDRS